MATPWYEIDPGAVTALHEAVTALLEAPCPSGLEEDYAWLASAMESGDTDELMYAVTDTVLALGRSQFSVATGETHVAESNGLDTEFDALRQARKRARGE